MKIFRSVLEELNSDGDYPALEDEAPDIQGEEIDFDNTQSLENFLSKIKFRDVHHEHPENERCEKLGGGKPLPRAESPLTDDAYSDEISLFLAIYGTYVFENIRQATNAKALKLKSEDILFRRYYPLSLADILEFFGILTIMSCEKNRENDDVRNFLRKWRNNPEFLDLQNYDLMPTSKFEFINFCLDIGEDKKVPKESNGRPILDLQHKFGPILNFFNEISEKVKMPDRNDALALDESLRGSYSKSNQLKMYMLLKPRKFGDKFFLLVDRQHFCYRIILQYPKQFSSFNGLNDLVQKIIPDRFKFLGFTLVCDNYFMTVSSLLKLQSQDTAVICTLRSNRLGKTLPPADLQQMTTHDKKNFQRQIRIKEAKTFTKKTANKTVHKYLQIQSYSDKKTSKPVLLGCTDPHLIQAGPGERNKNISKKLRENERPPLPAFYNSSMGFVDEYDRQITKYTLFLPVGRRPDRTAWTKKTCVFIVDMMIQNVYSFHREKFQDRNPDATHLPYRFRQNFQLNLGKAFLRKKFLKQVQF